MISIVNFMKRNLWVLLCLVLAFTAACNRGGAIPDPDPATNVKFDFGVNMPEGATVRVLMTDGTEHDVVFDTANGTRGGINAEKGEIIRSLQMEGGPVLMMGHVIGDNVITVCLNAEGKISTLPRGLDGAAKVNSIADFKFLNTAAGMNGSYKQTAHIDLMDQTWIPIGTIGDAFTGVYDGSGFEMRNINVSSIYDYQGLFAICQGGTIKNITVASGTIAGGTCVAGICGYLEDGSVINCVNYATIVPSVMRGGGIVGMLGRDITGSVVEDCVNYGNVRCPSTGQSQFFGGIAGANPAGCTIRNCTNEGNVEGPLAVAGIVGDNIGTVTGCINKGEVWGKGWMNMFTSKSGGICGAHGNESNRTASLTDCVNMGHVKGFGNLGGIAGTSYAIVEACVNLGSMESTSNFNAGLIGLNYGSLYASYSTGEIKGVNFTAGVVGISYEGGVVEACYSTSKINGSGTFPGLLAGRIVDPAGMKNCYYVPRDGIVGIGDDLGGENTVYEFGDPGVTATAWPSSTIAKWGVGSDYAAGKYWKSLGSWSASSPVYPTLNWE